MSQKDRVYRLLVARGAAGLTNVDMLLPGVADGGKPVTRLAGRIKELRDDGHRIVSKRLMNGTRYVLQDCSSVPAAPDVRGGSGPLDRGVTEEAGAVALFDLERQTVNAAIRDWDAA